MFCISAGLKEPLKTRINIKINTEIRIKKYLTENNSKIFFCLLTIKSKPYEIRIDPEKVKRNKICPGFLNLLKTGSVSNSSLCKKKLPPSANNSEKIILVLIEYPRPALYT